MHTILNGSLRGRGFCGILLLALTAGMAAMGQERPLPSAASRAEQAYRTAKGRFQADTNSVQAAWQFASACFDRAEFAESKAERAQLGNEGIAVCRQIIARDPRVAEAHYYLAINLGQVARTKKLAALRMVSEMESEFKLARELNENVDLGGPDRSLGLLYLDAPGWPTSIGSRSKSKVHLLKAVQLHPEFPENRLCLVEAYLKWNNRADARQEAGRLAGLLPNARTRFSGESWKNCWEDWDKRWQHVQSALNR